MTEIVRNLQGEDTLSVKKGIAGGLHLTVRIQLLQTRIDGIDDTEVNADELMTAIKKVNK